MSRAAELAKKIRTLVATTYPGIKFYVRTTESDIRYDRVEVTWAPGPSREEVQGLLAPLSEPGGVEVFAYPAPTERVTTYRRSDRLMARFGKRRFFPVYLAVRRDVERELGRDHPAIEERVMDATEAILLGAAKGVA